MICISIYRLHWKNTNKIKQDLKKYNTNKIHVPRTDSPTKWTPKHPGTAFIKSFSFNNQPVDAQVITVLPKPHKSLYMMMRHNQNKCTDTHKGEMCDSLGLLQKRGPLWMDFITWSCKAVHKKSEQNSIVSSLCAKQYRPFHFIPFFDMLIVYKMICTTQLEA